jgi:hypothetical protein
VACDDDSDLADTGVGADVSRDRRGVLGGRSDVALVLEVGQEALVVGREGARVDEHVGLARPAKGERALGLLTGWDGEHGALVLEERRRHRRKVGALDDHFGPGLADVERVAADVLKEVVDGVQEDNAADLGAAAREVLEVAAVDCDEVGLAELCDGGDQPEGSAGCQRSRGEKQNEATYKEHRPVVLGRKRGVSIERGTAQNKTAHLAVALRARGRGAVKERVADEDATCCFVSCYQHLAAHRRQGHVVNPDAIGADESDGVASPDQLKTRWF